MSMNQNEVDKQIQQMTRFIEQEALEKADEIDAKAEEEFNIEKGRIVQTQRIKLMEFYEKKEKQIDLQKKIQLSNVLNNQRLNVLKAREDHIATLLEETSLKLAGIASDRDQYKKILEGLCAQVDGKILPNQALVQLLETKVVFRCRSQDVDLVREVLPAAVNVYKKMTGKDTQFTVDEANPLPSDSAGGVEVLAMGGKIKVVNTLESRLNLVKRLMLPQIRATLFGENSSRRFFD